MVKRYSRGDLTWVDCVSPTHEEVLGLIREFSIDPLIAQELIVPSFKPKVERRGEALYVILHFPVIHDAHQKHELEIDFVIGKNFLLTARYEELEPLHSFAEAFQSDKVLGRERVSTHGGHLFTSLVRNLYIALNNGNDTLEEQLQAIEERIFTGEEKIMVARLSQVGRLIHDFRQSLQSHAEMLASLEGVGSRFFGQEFSYYVRDLIGTYDRIEHRLQNLRDSLGELRETNNSLLSTKQNEIMKTFTVLAFVFFPLSFITGLFGMNTEYTPVVGSVYGFWLILGGMVMVAGACFAYFNYKGWL